ncbi:hypothetical protein DL96DRAFT_1666080 [Flagelloscypha sp. PMI_526]|nr:hypothetical protein DL96DRAFT_1666080 [Flagelloscypha sp. PMI_526]
MSAPPNYAQPSSSLEGSPQIVIVPSSDSVNFQKGYLGADHERAAIEGELQIKGAVSSEWSKLTLALRSVESSFAQEIELGFKVYLGFPLSPLQFPLMSDTPQSIQTSHSSLSHCLTAVLHPLDPTRSAVTKTVQVFTRRYTAHSYVAPTSPHTFTHDDPTPLEVQIPRSTFKADEPIPVYVTVPPPRTELVVQGGLRLRNVRAELVRVIEVSTDADHEPEEMPPTPNSANKAATPRLDGPSSSSSSMAAHAVRTAYTPTTPKSPLLPGSSYRRVVSKSGASCRFHATRPVRLRFLLIQASPNQSGSSPSSNQMFQRENDAADSDSDYRSITQTTLLHTVSFHLHVLVSFIEMATRTEKISTIRIPIEIIAPSAPLPEVAASIDAEYRKKHDRPPLRTVRLDDAESSVPQYSEGQAGPSAIPAYGAPPPFEERDAPPPFFTPGEGSTAAGLPSFLESEREIIVAHDQAQSDLQHVPSSAHIGDAERSSTPPPSLEMASQDTDITGLTEIQEARQRERAQQETERPPPPPAMDDPMDPPPAIDFEFPASEAPPLDSHDPSAPAPPMHESDDHSPPPEQQQQLAATSSPSTPPASSVQIAPGPNSNAPPPYLGDTGHGPAGQEADRRPPPYVDY